MYISNIYIKNIKCFSDVSVKFDLSKETPQWTTFIGDNGTGKTTFLKCIAMGLCDETSAAGLLREIPWELRSKKNNSDGIIRITLSNGENEEFLIETIVKSEKQIERIERKITNERGGKIPDKDFEWNKIFICGYGANRGTEGTQDYLKYSIIDAVYTLFRYDQLLQNPELALRRLIQKLSKLTEYPFKKKSAFTELSKILKNIMKGDLSEKESHEWLIKLLKTTDIRKKLKNILKGRLPEQKAYDWLMKLLKPILQLSETDDIELKKDGIWIKNQSWGQMPFATLGDGYKSTLTWVMDFISWSSIYHNDIINNDISGIVIVDELEQHLHPKWQRTIINDLIKAFPKVQFIATTHSPLIVSNSDLLYNPKYSNKVYHFGFQDGVVLVDELEEINGVLTCDQILASKAFDYIINQNSEIENILKEASILALKKERTKEEEEQYAQFKEKLKEIMFPKGRSLIERIVEKEYYDKLQDEINSLKDILGEK